MGIYFYKLGYSEYDGGGERIFYSSMKYSEEEFEEIIIEMMSMAVNIYIEVQKNKEYPFWCIPSEVIKIVYTFMELLHGFKPLEYTVDYSVYRDTIIKSKKRVIDEIMYSSEFSSPPWIIENLDMQTLSKIIKYNEELDRQLK